MDLTLNNEIRKLCGTHVKYQLKNITNLYTEGLLKDSNSELWQFFCCSPEQAVEQAVDFPVIWDAMTPVQRHWIKSIAADEGKIKVSCNTLHFF